MNSDEFRDICDRVDRALAAGWLLTWHFTFPDEFEKLKAYLSEPSGKMHAIGAKWFEDARDGTGQGYRTAMLRSLNATLIEKGVP